MALVDYGSDSDSDSQPCSSSAHPLPPTTSHPQPIPTINQPQATTLDQPSGLRLPPPKRNKPTKARILIGPAPTDLKSSTVASKRSQSPSRSNLEQESGPTKRPKFDASSVKKPSGLAALLPAPKNAAPTPKPGKPNISSISFKPTIRPVTSHSASTQHASTPQPNRTLEPPSVERPETCSLTGGLNLFGLPTSTTQVKDRLARPSSLVTTTISSAPQVAEEKPPPPTLSDPYPGYWQRPNGQWVARAADDPEWKAFYAENYGGAQDQERTSKEVPKDFFKQAGDRGGMEEFNAAKVAQKAWENKPKIIDPREEARQEQAAQAAGKPAVCIFSI